MNPITPEDIPRVRFLGTSFQEALRFSHEAMATVFEIFVIHEEADYAQQAAWEAFGELDRLEKELSRFIENSDVSRINRLKRNQTTTIGSDAFACIKQAFLFTEMTHGIYNINFGSISENGLNPKKLERNANAEGAFHHPLVLDENACTVRLVDDAVSVDLGGLGKGYALDRMADLLREWDITSILLHGGMSSVLTLDSPPGEKGWPLTLSHPQAGGKVLSRPILKHRSISGSGVRKGQHIIHPGTGLPVQNRLAAWAIAPKGVMSDALSTTFMIMTPEEIGAFCYAFNEIQALIVSDRRGADQIEKFGRWE